MSARHKLTKREAEIRGDKSSEDLVLRRGPDGAMLLECDAPCEGFCLVTQMASRRGISFAFTFLPAVNYSHLLGEDEPFELRGLGEKLSERAPTIKDALELMDEARGEDIPLLLL